MSLLRSIGGLLLASAVLVACATAPEKPRFSRVLQFKPGIQGNTVWGYVRYDSLGPSTQAKAAALGYKFGDEIPARQDEGGAMYFLKPPATDLRSTIHSHWERM